jgi:hypothetical protein
MDSGFVVSVVRDLGLPVKFIGVGERIEDLRDFEPEVFVDALLGNDEETSAKLKEKVAKMMNLSPAKALEQAMALSALSGSGTGAAADPSARLRSSFQSNGDEVEIEEASDKTKPKRAKRPKPQSSKSKKSKK